MQYTKLPKTIDEQIQLLLDRGLIIDDTERAKHYLSNISFYRLRAYTYPFQDNSDPNHPFTTKITFDEILNLYIFDRELRLLLMDAIERIEVAVRTHIIYVYSIRYDSQWNYDSRFFYNEERFENHIEQLEKEVERSHEDFIKHYQNTYTSPVLPPSWMALEVISFGLLSKIYGNLKERYPKKRVAKNFGLMQPRVLVNWLHMISLVRNIVAHHGRLWNREFILNVRLPKKTKSEWIKNTDVPKNKLYILLCCIYYLLRTINPTTSFSQRLKEVIGRYPHIDIEAMGFPEDWEKEQFWM